MTLPVVHNVGTLLRHHNDSLQRIIPQGSVEQETIPPAQDAGMDVIDALSAMGAGTPPIEETGEVIPNASFKMLIDESLASAINRLGAVTSAMAEDDEPGQFAKIQTLKARVNQLKGEIATAATR